MIIALSGPSGIGKGYIKGQLLHEYPHMRELPWLTTRQLRPHEQSGNHRVSVTLDAFNEAEKSGRLALVRDLYGHRYGLEKEHLRHSDGIKLTELHPDVLHAAQRANPAIIVIGLITRDVTLLRERLSIIRRTESPTEIETRISNAIAEIDAMRRIESSYTSLIEITRQSESLVFDQVRAVLTLHLTGR